MAGAARAVHRAHGPGLLNARGKSEDLIGVDPPLLVADWTVYCVAFGTDPSDVGLWPDANGHCSKAQDPPDQTPQPPDDGSCSSDGLEDRMKDVQDKCCTMIIGDGGTESVCAYGKMPTSCDVHCAELFLPFWDDCEKMLASAAVAEAHQDLPKLAGYCKAAQEAEGR